MSVLVLRTIATALELPYDVIDEADQADAAGRRRRRAARDGPPVRWARRDHGDVIAQHSARRQ